MNEKLARKCHCWHLRHGGYENFDLSLDAAAGAEGVQGVRSFLNVL